MIVFLVSSVGGTVGKIVGVLVLGLAALVFAQADVRRFVNRLLGISNGPRASDRDRLTTAMLGVMSLVWLAGTFVVQRGLLRGFSRGIWGADYDGGLNLWVLAWVHHALFTGGVALFDANIFYPARDSLALSDHRLPDQLFFAPAYALTRSPTVAYNVVMTAQFVLTALTCALLAFHLFRSWRGAALAGTMFALSPTRLAHLHQSALISACWTPLAILFLDRFLSSRAWRDALGFAFCFALQFLTAYYLGYFLLIIAFVWTAGQAIARPRELFRLEVAGKAVAAVFLIASLVVPFSLPYLRVRAEYGALEVPLDFLERASAEGVTSYLASRPESRLYGRLLSPSQSGLPWEKWLFPGFLCLSLASLALGLSMRAATGIRWRVWLLWAQIGTAFLLSLGPTIHLAGWAIPSPYLLLWQFLPGFPSMRVPARLGMVVAFGLALAATAGYRWIEERLPPRARAAVFILALAAVIAESTLSPAPISALPRPPDIPEEYRWLASHGDGAVLELPIRVPAGVSGDRLKDILQETRYMYYSLSHWRPLVNGRSGHRPKAVVDDVLERVNALPSEESFSYLRAIGVRQVLVHPESQLHTGMQSGFGALVGPPGRRFPNGAVLVTLPHLPAAGDVVVRPLAPARWSGGEQSLGVLFANAGNAYWVNRIQRACPVELTWKGSTGALLKRERRLVLPPVALAPGEMREQWTHVRVPHAEDLVRLATTVSCNRADSERQAWSHEVPITLVSSVSSADGYTDGLEVAYLGYYVPSTVCPGCRLLFRLHVQNTGSSLWKREGSVQLGVFWMDSSGRRLSNAHFAIERNVYPGGEVVLRGSVESPETPGPYSLGFDLVHSEKAWFGPRREPALRWAVTVK